MKKITCYGEILVPDEINNDWIDRNIIEHVDIAYALDNEMKEMGCKYEIGCTMIQLIVKTPE